MNFDYKKVIKPEINVGDREQRIRLLAGTVSVFISIFTASIILLLVGLVLIATGYFGRCPAYAGINFNTLDKGSADPVAPAATENTDKAKQEAKPKPAAKKPAKKSSTASKTNTAAKKTSTTSKTKAASKSKSTAKK